MVFILGTCCVIFYVVYVAGVMHPGKETVDIVIGALEIYTIAIPPVLPLALSLGSQFSLCRLRAKKVFCINPSKLNVAGRVKTICFDKTGTLTEESLKVDGFRTVTLSNQAVFTSTELETNIYTMANEQIGKA
jgi:cation-transporting P-type ATPase 13A2